MSHKCSYNGHIDDFIDPGSGQGLGVFFCLGAEGLYGLQGGGVGGGGGVGWRGGVHPASGDKHIFTFVMGGGGRGGYYICHRLSVNHVAVLIRL